MTAMVTLCGAHQGFRALKPSDFEIFLIIHYTPMKIGPNLKILHTIIGIWFDGECHIDTFSLCYLDVKVLSIAIGAILRVD